MESVRNQLKNPILAGVVGLVVGIIIGLIYAWVISPVDFVDATANYLREDLRVDYLRMSIDSYGQHQNAAEAQTRWDALGVEADAALAAVEAAPGQQDPAAIDSFKAAVGVEVLPGDEVPPEEGGSPIGLLIFACVLVLVFAVALGVVIFLRRPTGGGTASTGETSPAMAAAEVTRQTERTDYQAIGEEPPLSQYMTTYMLGDDLFDDSFSVDSAAGEFLGECGVGIAETIGVGDPKRVSAFEVWLFDKNDIQTVTKVLMSGHAYNDPATQERLAAKGEPVMAEANGQVVLETATLQLIAKVVDISYGNGSMPEDSYFERLTLELAVWNK
jgi:hypothetical protein